MECIWLNFLVPMMVRKEVKEVHSSVQNTIIQLCSLDSTNTSNMDKQTDNYDHIVLDMPQYLFVSVVVANQFPDLMESMIIRSYHTHLPGQLAHKWIPFQRSIIVRSRSFISRALTLLGSFLIVMQYIGTAPFVVQRMIIRFLQPFLFVGLALLYSLSVSSVAGIVISSAIVFIIIVCLISRYYKEKKQEQCMSQITPLQQNDAWDSVINNKPTNNLMDNLTAAPLHLPAKKEYDNNYYVDNHDDGCSDSSESENGSEWDENDYGLNITHKLIEEY
eukprot:gene14168-19009_t